MKKTLLLSSVLVATLFASGYRIPEQSLKGIALSAANVANASGADSAYYNPANMVFNEDKNSFELLTTMIHLNKVKFQNDNGEVYYSRKEDFIVPQFHFTSKDYNGWRFGFSVTYPAGLSKRWDDTIPEAGAKEFTLKTIELNPVIAKKVNENIGVAFGIRFVKSEGIANVLGLKSNGDGTYTPLYSEYLNGDSFDKGWNAAVAFRSDDRTLRLAATYRSKINLSLSGDASGFYNLYLITGNPADAAKVVAFNTPGKVTVPLPAVLNLAIAKKFGKTTLEFVFDRTYWHSYKKLDFDFKDPAVNAIFGTPKPKDWKDSNTYRFGITHQCSEKLTAMLGYAYDESPVPNSTIDFSLPDSDKHIFSGGIKYKLDDRMSVGISALYTKQKTRRASVYDPITKTYTNGEFKEGGAVLFAAGFDYTF
ncbi:MAG: transporter [Epsilonproteobacteria bacterium]|nr:transporter [Campylobacterota bacterium]